MALLEQEYIADHILAESTADTPLKVPRRRVLPRWLVCVPLLLLTFWLGARGLNADAIWYDEWLSIYYAGGAHYGGFDLVRTWAEVARISTWPPGFQSALAGWVALTGSEQVGLRLFPLLIGLLAVAWMYRLGREMGSPLVGSAAAVMLGGSAFFIYYLHELRAYTLYVLCVIVMVWAYWRIVGRGKADLPTQLVFTFAVGASLYVHYFAALAAPGLAVYHLLFVKKDRAWWRIPYLIAMGTLLFLPWWIVAYKHASDAFTSEVRRIIPLGWWEITQTLLISFGNGGGVLLFGLLLLYALPFGKDNPRRRVVTLTWVWLLVALGVGLLLNERLQVIFHVRHLVVAFPALALLTGFGLEALTRAYPAAFAGLRLPKIAALVLGLWLAAGVYHSVDGRFMHTQPGAEPTLAWETLSPVLAHLQAHSDEEDNVVFHLEAPGREWLTQPVVDYYLYDMGVEAYTQFEEIRGLEADDDYYWQALRWIDNAPRVWTAILDDAPAAYHVREFQRALAADYVGCGAAVTVDSLRLDLYVQRRDQTNRMDLRFGGRDGIHVRLLADLPTSVTDEFPALFGVVAGEDVTPGTLAVGLHIDDADGNFVAQRDVPLPPEAFTCVMQTVDVSALPPGEYTFRLVVYDLATGARLEGRDLRDGDLPREERLAVGTFRIE